MATISLNAVDKIYDGGTQAVHSVNMDIKDGEFVVFVGPSGCGKSTLLRMIAGLETITNGEVSIGDRVVNKVSPADRDVAMVFQNYALYPHMSVYDNMAYGLKNRGMAKSGIDAKVREAAKMLQIDPFLERKPSQLSGGQRQRVAMGRAITRDPAVYLFDEPLSNLDAKLRVEMRLEIKQLQRRLGVTSIYVTHDQAEAMTLADKLVVINQGRIEQMGTPIELYRDPDSLFVADFLGSPRINLLEGSLKGGTWSNGSLTLDGFADLPDCENAVMAVRPEELVPAENGDLSCSVLVTEQHGAENIVHFDLADSNLHITARRGKEFHPATGETVGLSFDRATAFMFDKNTGKRLRG